MSRPLVIALALCATPGFAAAANPDELVAQAIRFEHAEGVRRSYVKAADLYCTAARLGHADAAYRLGWMYANGRGIERSDEMAAGLFGRAAAQGHSYAARAGNYVKAARSELPDCLSDKQADAARLQKDLAAEQERLKVAQVQVASAAASPATPARAEAEIAATLERWASAWSRRDVQGYLATYAADFAVPAGHSRQSWASERARRIVEKSAIAVELRELEISVDGDHARARFVQDYRSDRFSDRSIKTVSLVRSGGTWLIQRENAR